MPKRDLCGKLGAYMDGRALEAPRTGWFVVVGISAMLACVDRGEVVAWEHPAAAAGGPAAGAAGSAGTAGSQSGAVQRPVFEEPQPVKELNAPDAKDQDPTLTADLLTILFFSDRGGDEDIWASQRPSIDDPWEAPREVAELNSDAVEHSPAISPDGLRLWYYSQRDPAGLWYSERETRNARWSDPRSVPIEVTDPPGVVIAPALDDLELRLAVSVGTSESRDIHELVRVSWDTPWSAPAAIAGLNSGAADSTPFLIGAGSEVLFSSARSGNGDLFWAYRDTPALPVERVEELTELNDPQAFESHPHLAADRSVIYFGSTRTGNTDIFWAAVR